MTTPLLDARHLSVTLRQTPVLTDINLQLHPGELVGVIGPNGVGKSTLLKSLMGFQKLDDGEVFLNGKAITNYSHHERARYLSYLAQETNEGFAYRVLDLVAMGAYSQITDNARAKAQWVLDGLELGYLAERSLTELSGGERQLAHIARLFMQDASLMLLDEPTAALDIGHEAQILEQLRRVIQQDKKSALIAIHNLNSAAEFCDRLVVMSCGEIIADGSPETVLTPQLIEKLYGKTAVVGHHPQTGSVTVLPVRQMHANHEVNVHVIGGAGSAILPSKWLFDAGITVTAGIAHEQDSDTLFWQQQGVDFISVPAFSEITDSAFDAALEKINQSDWVVLCDFPIGPGNQRNLELASKAKNLVLIRESEVVDGSMPESLQELMNTISQKAATVSLSQFERFIAEQLIQKEDQ